MSSQNCVSLFERHASAAPARPALWLPGRELCSFGDLRGMSAGAQEVFAANGVGPGDFILLVDSLGPRLYAAVIGALASGIGVVLVEPWLPVARIDEIIEKVKPRAFLTNWLGRVWGVRIPQVRGIKKWISTAEIKATSQRLRLEEVAPEAHAILTFTSGTTGKPKGVVRNHGYLLRQFEVLNKNLANPAEGLDLCIFANFALLNLAAGRGSAIIPPAWKSKALSEAGMLAGALRVTSVTCGPAFLRRLMEQSGFKDLYSIHVGGALTDCELFEKAFTRWPDAHFTHIYGSSEVEPVALSEARNAVRMSRQRGYLQTLFLGTPVPELHTSIEGDECWVAGPHVCPSYFGNDEENRLNKRKDAAGAVWHRMGDRIQSDADGWWYQGRSQQPSEMFELEQRVYALLGSAASFVGEFDGRRILLGEGVGARAVEVRDHFPQIDRVIEAKIVRDKRHRARIDRIASARKAGLGR